MNSVISLLGSNATSYDETLKNADLNWDVKEDKVAGADTGIMFPGRKMLFRSDNNAPLGIVGKDYTQSCPKEFLKSQFEFADFIKGKVDRAGFLADRSRAFAFVKLNEDIIIKPENRKVGDILSVHIYSTDGWDGGTPRRSRLFIERLKCLNGARSSEIKANLWVRHTSGMEATYNVRWKKFMNEVQTSVTAIAAQFNKLAQVKMNEAQMLEFATELMPAEGTRAANTRQEIVDLFSTGVGNEGRTRWDAYNAVTEYVTHHRTYRETETTGATTNHFLGVLETDTLANKALSLLLHTN